MAKPNSRYNESDNTRVNKEHIENLPKESTSQKVQIEIPQIYDAEKSEYYENLQNFTNSNFFGRGISGTQTRLNPRTDREAIQSNYDYAKNNAEDFVLNIATHAAIEGIAQGVKYLATPIVKNGAQSSVKMYRLPFSKVVKTSSITPQEAEELMQVPGMQKLTFLGKTKDGFYKYSQNKLRTSINENKVLQKLDELLKNHNWREILFKDYDGKAYTKNGMTLLDLEQNIGETRFLKRPRIFDAILMPNSEAQVAFNKFGNKLRFFNKKHYNK